MSLHTSRNPFVIGPLLGHSVCRCRINKLKASPIDVDVTLPIVREAAHDNNFGGRLLLLCIILFLTHEVALALHGLGNQRCDGICRNRKERLFGLRIESRVDKHNCLGVAVSRNEPPHRHRILPRSWREENEHVLGSEHGTVHVHRLDRVVKHIGARRNGFVSEPRSQSIRSAIFGCLGAKVDGGLELFSASPSSVRRGRCLGWIDFCLTARFFAIIIAPSQTQLFPKRINIFAGILTTVWALIFVKFGVIFVLDCAIIGIPDADVRNVLFFLLFLLLPSLLDVQNSRRRPHRAPISDQDECLANAAVAAAPQILRQLAAELHRLDVVVYVRTLPYVKGREAYVHLQQPSFGLGVQGGRDGLGGGPGRRGGRRGHLPHRADIPRRFEEGAHGIHVGTAAVVVVVLLVVRR
mmetsp:Transcript_30251/g.88478  ORF Transcript_30251/g.88478 Transcript_30251/m.88478 type:complete len:410 (-) Transcript_30251:209-1438(-)